MPFLGEMQIDHGGFESRVSEVTLDETEVDAGFEQMGGVGMSEGMDGDAEFGNAGPLFRFAKGALDAVSAHGIRGARGLLLIAPGGGKEPGFVTMGFPVGPQQNEGVFGQGDVAVFGALAAVDMDL